MLYIYANKKEIMDKLRQFLDDEMMGMRTLSDLANVSKSALYTYMSGKRRPQRLTALKICKASNGKLTIADFGYSK